MPDIVPEMPRPLTISYHLALLRAIAEKLIPGIPLSTRISLLQQTSQDVEDEPAKAEDMNPHLSKKPVLQYIVESDAARNKVLHDVNGEFNDGGWP